MTNGPRALLLAGLCIAAGCQAGGGVWFKGDETQAAASAAERDTLVMMEFYTDWCSWCRRLETETFADPRVMALLEELVPMRVNAEGKGEHLARRYGVDSYPTVVFVSPEGHEVDRILGYLPPEPFIDQTERIRAGDTFMSCLHSLSEDPANINALARSVEGLLERSDPEGAISRIKAYHHADDGHSHHDCDHLMFRARSVLQERFYGQAAKWYQRGWGGTFAVPETEGTRHLSALVTNGVIDLDPMEQAEMLRRARHDDAAELLDMVEPERAPVTELVDMADFAFQNGHYDLAVAAYRRWFAEVGSDADPDSLNTAAWQLYLLRRDLDTAAAMARAAYGRDPSPDVADTLARVLYVQGEVGEAMDLEHRAAATANPEDAEFFRDGLNKMQEGRDLGDRPDFEIYPGQRIERSANLSRSVI